MKNKLFRQISEEEQIYNLNTFNKYTRGTLIEVHIADIHFGAIDPKYQYTILKEQFLNKLYNINADIVSINGDLLDHKFMSNSDVIMYCIMFMNELVDICRRNNTTLLIINGTEYHDAHQLKLFYHYINDSSVDVRIIEDIQFEYVKGAKILCIPETYGLGEDYYKQFLNNSGIYDTVFMHGVIKGAIYQAKNQESGIHTDKAPTFKIDDFKFCRGPIISGHVHTTGCFDTYFYYCGSPMRWRHGEEETKGFFVVLHNLDTHEHYVHLEPIESLKYITVNLSDMLFEDPKGIIEHTETLRMEQNIDYLRIIFKDIYTDQQRANLDIIKSYYRNNSKIKIMVSENKLKQNMEEDKVLSDQYSKYSYILDSGLSEYDKLVMYINQQQNCNYITVDELKKILSEDL